MNDSEYRKEQIEKSDNAIFWWVNAIIVAAVALAVMQKWDVLVLLVAMILFFGVFGGCIAANGFAPLYMFRDIGANLRDGWYKRVGRRTD